MTVPEHVQTARLRRVLGWSKPNVFLSSGSWHVQPHPPFVNASSDDRRAFNDLMRDRNEAAFAWIQARG
jgi:hypothetical protein